MPSPHQILQSVFGYSTFQGPQEAIVAHLVAGGDAIVLMPTGGGKSICYQIPALVRPGVGVVVSPLIALMQDQVDALKELGVAAAFLNSSLTTAEAIQAERAVLAGDIKLLYVAPERLLTPRFLALLDRLDADGKIALFAIDEAHCVSQWGHDFRADYLQLSVLAERFPNVPRVALTATADTMTRQGDPRPPASEQGQRIQSPVSTAPTSATPSPSATTSTGNCAPSCPSAKAIRASSIACRGRRWTLPPPGW